LCCGYVDVRVVAGWYVVYISCYVLLRCCSLFIVVVTYTFTLIVVDCCVVDFTLLRCSLLTYHCSISCVRLLLLLFALFHCSLPACCYCVYVVALLTVCCVCVCCRVGRVCSVTFCCAFPLVTLLVVPVTLLFVYVVAFDLLFRVVLFVVLLMFVVLLFCCCCGFVYVR